MEERRKNDRMKLVDKLMIKRMDQSGDAEEVYVDVTDASKTGVGFICGSQLMVGAMYESYLTIWTKEVLHVFLEIIRVEKRADGTYDYGAIFIGMSEMDASRIATYHTITGMEKMGVE